MPLPAGGQSRFLARRDYRESHGVTIAPGRATAELTDVGEVELAEFHPFEDGSGWALAADGKLYAKSSEGPWQEHKVRVSTEKLGPTPEPRIRGDEIATLENKSPIRWARFSPTGEVIVTFSEDTELRVQRPGIHAVGLPLKDRPSPRLGRSSFDPMGPRLIIPAGPQVFVLHWNLNTSLQSIAGDGKDQFSAAAFAPDGRIVTWSEASGLAFRTREGRLQDHVGTVTDPTERFLFSSNGRFMALTSRFFTTSVFRFPELFYVADLSGRAIAFTSQQNQILLENDKGGLVVAEFAKSIVETDKGVEDRGQLEAKLLAVDPQNDTLLAQNPKEQIIIWNYGAGTKVPVEGAAGTIASFSSDGARFALGQFDGSVEFFDINGQRLPGRLPGRGEPLRSLAFAPDGGRLLTVTADGVGILWDVRMSVPEPAPETVLEDYDGSVRTLHFTDSLSGLLIMEDGAHLKTVNGGQSWSEQDVPEDEAFRAFRPRALTMNDPGLGWLVGERGSIARGEAGADGRVVWSLVDTPTDQTLTAVRFENRNAGFAAGDAGTVLSTDDGGKKWDEVKTNFTDDLTSVHIQGKLGWVAAAPLGDQLPWIYQTGDGGQTWQAIDYSELPAPLLLFVTLPLLTITGFVLVGFWQKQVVTDDRVEPIGKSDRPIGWDDPDPLGFQPIAKGLSSFLRNKNTIPPLTIGINGPWGTGKSSLMNLLREDLQQYGCNAVWFNAWHHQKEEHLLAALLEAIRKQVVPKLWQPGGLRFRWRLLYRRSIGDLQAIIAFVLLVSGLFVAYEVMVEGDDVPRPSDLLAVLSGESPGREGATTSESTSTDATAESGESEPDVSLQSGEPASAQSGAPKAGTAQFKANQGSKKKDGPITLTELLELLQENDGVLGSIAASLIPIVWIMLRLRVLPSDPAKLMARLGRRASVRTLREQLGFRTTFQAEFSQVCDALRWQGSAGLVILIDDLDRCQPKQVLEVLEAVNFLSTAGDCFIILGMARRQVENCVAIEFKDFIVEGLDREEPSLLRANDMGNANSANGQDRADEDQPSFLDLMTVHGATSEDDSDDESDEQRATDDQRRFAKHYLEKMINIELAVPRGNPEDGWGLLNPEPASKGSGRRMQWRRRFYGALGLGYVVLFGALAGIVGAQVLPDFLESEVPARGAGVDSGAGEQRSSGSGAAGTGPPIEESSTKPPETANGQTVSDEQEVSQTVASARPVQIPPLLPVHLEDSRKWWEWTGLSLVLIALLVTMFVRRALRPADHIVEDTQHFNDAIERWYPMIYAANPTPRGIKRFENRMRFLAMQTRPLKPAPDAIDHILNWLEKSLSLFAPKKATEKGKVIEKGNETEKAKETKKEDKGGDEQGQKSGIGEDMLVGLGVVEAIDSETLRDKSPQDVHAIVLAQTDGLGSRLWPAKSDQGKKYLDRLVKLRAYIVAGESWPPTPESLNEYRRISGRIRG